MKLVCCVVYTSTKLNSIASSFKLDHYSSDTFICVLFAIYSPSLSCKIYMNLFSFSYICTKMFGA